MLIHVVNPPPTIELLEFSNIYALTAPNTQCTAETQTCLVSVLSKVRGKHLPNVLTSLPSSFLVHPKGKDAKSIGLITEH